MATIPPMLPPSDSEAYASQPQTGVVLCSATAERCECHKPEGHVEEGEEGDEVHECNPRLCTGAWVGTYSSDDSTGPITFRIVRLPLPVRAQ